MIFKFSPVVGLKIVHGAAELVLDISTKECDDRSNL
jgi:hypothetical protein